MDNDTWSAMQPFISAPTTPRSKKKRCHFADTPPERIGPQRTRTAPPGFAAASTFSSVPFEEQQWPLGHDISPDEQEFPVLLEDPETPSYQLMDDDGDATFIQDSEIDDEDCDVEVEEPPGSNDTSTPPEELPRVSSLDDPDEPDPDFLVKREKSHSITGAWPLVQDGISPIDYHRSPSLPMLYSKVASSSVVTTHSAASPAHPFNMSFEDDQPISPGRTSESGGSFLSAKCDQRSDTGPDLFEPTSKPSSLKIGHRKHTSSSGDEFDVIKSRLSALSQAGGCDDVASVSKRRKMTPEAQDIAEWPRSMRNDTRIGRERSRHGSDGHGNFRSSSPIPTVKKERVQPHTPPVIFRSNLKQGMHNKSKSRLSPAHRDSLKIARHRLADKWPMTDPSLSSTRDSLVLTKQRFDKYLKPQAIFDVDTGQVKFGGLSPIMDASPPDVRAHFAARHEQSRQDKARSWLKEIGGHPDNDDECPICQVERPRSRRLLDYE